MTSLSRTGILRRKYVRILGIHRNIRGQGVVPVPTSAGNSMPNFSRKLLTLLLIAIAGTAFAQDEEPQRPEDVYRYAVFDTGDAIEIDWAIEDGYYLYRNKLSFESATSDIELADPRLPEGLPHEDEFFGKQQIYRGNFYVSIP